MRRAARLMAATLLTLTGCDTLALDPPPRTTSTSTTAWPEMLRAVNAARARGAVCSGTQMPPAAPVAWDDRLRAAASRHVTDMARTGRFDHIGSDGSDVGDRSRAAGYAYRMLGENIAAGQPSVERVVAEWMRSGGHCRQIMDPAFVQMGAAERGGYWVQVFGRPQ
jgi:uncharacterized protein YkwD